MRFPSATIVLMLLLCHSGHGQNSQVGAEQRFGLEEPFRNPVKLPDSVLKMLISQPPKVDCSADGPVDQSWFTATNIILNPLEDPGLIVKPSFKGGCLSGANLGPFWIFRRRGEVYDLLLNESALEVDRLTTKTNGFQDLQFSAAITGGRRIVSLSFTFSNGKYRLANRRTVSNQ
jgi:hypothetical protein